MRRPATPDHRVPRPHARAVLTAACATLACATLACEAPPGLPNVSPAAAVVPAPAPAVAHRGDTPISGRLTGVARTTLLSAPATYRVDVSTTGPVSHGGIARAAWAIPEATLDLVGGFLRVTNASWSGTLDMANGDQIAGVYTLRASDIPLSPTGEFVLTADVRVTGGTGRFQGVSGDCVTIVRGSVVTRVTTVDFSGRLVRDLP